MDTYEIITIPDPVLKQKAETIETVGENIRLQADRMLATMYGARGIGLAANQVSLLNRIIVMDVNPDSWVYGPEIDGVLTIDSAYRSGDGDEPEERQPSPIIMINPEVVWSSDQKSVFDEGCLSIPQQYAEIVRPAAVRVKYVDYTGQQAELEAHGLLSHCVQHEIDHLNGVLFIDYLSSLKRNMIIKKFDKLKKQKAL